MVKENNTDRKECNYVLQMIGSNVSIFMDK